MPALAALAGAVAPAALAAPEHPHATQGTVRKGDFVHRMLLTGDLKAPRAHEIVVPRIPDLTEMLVDAVLSAIDDGRVEPGDPLARDAPVGQTGERRVTPITPASGGARYDERRR